MSLVALYTCQKSFNFIDAFNYKQKCKLAPFNLAHPVYYRLARSSNDGLKSKISSFLLSMNTTPARSSWDEWCSDVTWPMQRTWKCNVTSECLSEPERDMHPSFRESRLDSRRYTVVN